MDYVYCEPITNNRACVKDIGCVSATVGATINEAIYAIQGTGGAGVRLKTSCKRDQFINNHVIVELPNTKQTW